MLRFYEHSMHFLLLSHIFHVKKTILVTYKKAIEYDFPGNSDAQALLYEEITTQNMDDDEKPQPAAIVDTKDEFETNKTEVEYLRNDVDAKEQLEESEEPLELLLDFIESKGLKLTNVENRNKRVLRMNVMFRTAILRSSKIR